MSVPKAPDITPQFIWEELTFAQGSVSQALSSGRLFLIPVWMIDTISSP